jgi:hypothetical protein
METSTRIIDFHLKGSIAEQKLKNNITRKQLIERGKPYNELNLTEMMN